MATMLERRPSSNYEPGTVDNDGDVAAYIDTLHGPEEHELAVLAGDGLAAGAGAGSGVVMPYGLVPTNPPGVLATDAMTSEPRSLGRNVPVSRSSKTYAPSRSETGPLSPMCETPCAAMRALRPPGIITSAG